MVWHFGFETADIEQDERVIKNYSIGNPNSIFLPLDMSTYEFIHSIHFCFDLDLGEYLIDNQGIFPIQGFSHFAWREFPMGMNQFIANNDRMKKWQVNKEISEVEEESRDLLKKGNGRDGRKGGTDG